MYEEELKQKEKVLEEYLKSLNSVIVAFSSGVDSTFLLKKAKQVLKDNVIAVTAKSCSFPKRELDEAISFCNKENIKHIIIQSEELDIDGFKQNPKNRCYLCKHELFEKMIDVAKKEGIDEVIEGSNMDDMGDYRPGLQAISELNIKSPLRYAKLYKNEIRDLSKILGLKTWNKPSFACLSSRFVYGETINEEKLKMVDQAEQLLLDLDFHQVRVRIHGNNMARIEVNPEEIQKLIDNKNTIIENFKKFGFTYITLDLEGYRTGSMNNFKK